MNDKQGYPEDQDNTAPAPLPFQEAPIPAGQQQHRTSEQDEQDEEQRKLREQAGSSGKEYSIGQAEHSQPGEDSESREGALRQDGYRDTKGSSYGPSKSGYGEPQGGKGPAEQGYDPSKSGVQPAKNKPGTVVNAPGRETGTAWGEDQQMGHTDAPDRRNPAG